MLLDIPRIPDIPEGWKYLAGSLAGGGIAIIVTLLNNHYQLRKDTQQWEREKLWSGYQKCTSSLILMESLWIDILSPKKTELWRELKDKENAYGWGSLTERQNEQLKEIEEQKEEMAEQILSIYSEMYPYLYWIIYNHPNPVLKEITILKESIEQKQGVDINLSFIDENKFTLMPPISAVQSMRQELIQLMTNDPRLLKK
jgi:hypothetical protein